MPTLLSDWRLIAIGLVAYTLAIWHAHTIYDRAKDADQLSAGQDATHQEMKASFGIDADFNTLIASLGILENNVNQSIEHETPLPVCGLDAGRVSAFRKAIAGNNPAR